MSEKFLVVHNSKKFEVTVAGAEGDEITLYDLSNAIADQCDVPPSKQKIICKGKTLSPQSYGSTLKELGVSSRDKILLLGQRINEEEAKHLKALAKVDNNVEDLRRKFDERVSELNGIDQGFLDAGKTKEALQKMSKNMAGLGEGWMNQMESLDALTIDTSLTDVRNKRKALIGKIQKYLTDSDREEERIKQMLSKL